MLTYWRTRLAVLKDRLAIFSRGLIVSFIYAESRGRISDICVCRVHLGLDLGRTGNFPWTRGDGSLLTGGGPVAAGVLEATA
ncbi:hypothetical protein EYF80_056786 [Liparis tanakae]|uniref:Uncharacterized protein n=1 Tax=Liparis tanakae TaxID=230148 RepID=A0A4Z2EWV3_9TELE|nr:hypothetical protein EYF80_056786 [Liparis tanakae]